MTDAPQVTKLFFDCRCDVTALYSQFSDIRHGRSSHRD
jgi:hypothetical protein